jgi:two-component system LytT family response regulator
MAMRVLIVDDEAPARARLRQMLASEEGCEIAGEAETGTQAIQMVDELKPDVILLDIQMPGLSGIDVAASLPQPRAHVIFCTAFDQHAVDAFELNALDYLLKPISRARLKQALDRARPALAKESCSTPARFLARSGSRYVVIGETQVVCFSSEGGVTRMVAESGQYWMDQTLNELEARLNSTRFFRISRAAMVSLNAVQEVSPMVGGAGEVLLKNGLRLEVSRRRFRDLLQTIGGTTGSA